MNSCVLMAEIIKDPELRYTQDGQVPIAEMLVQFPGLRAEDPAETLKVIGWGNLAQQIQEQFHQGDRVVIEGRLGMNRIERPEGFKETRAELTASRIHLLGQDATLVARVAVSSPEAAKTTATASPGPTMKLDSPAAAKPKSRTVANEPAASPKSEAAVPNYDDIPF